MVVVKGEGKEEVEGPDRERSKGARMEHRKGCKYVIRGLPSILESRERDR